MVAIEFDVLVAAGRHHVLKSRIDGSITSTLYVERCGTGRVRRAKRTKTRNRLGGESLDRPLLHRNITLAKERRSGTGLVEAKVVAVDLDSVIKLGSYPNGASGFSGAFAFIRHEGCNVDELLKTAHEGSRLANDRSTVTVSDEHHVVEVIGGLRDVLSIIKEVSRDFGSQPSTR